MNFESKKKRVKLMDESTGYLKDVTNFDKLYLSGDKKVNSQKPVNNATGSSNKFEGLKEIVFPFEKYNVRIILTPFNEFVGIREISINKEFLTHKEKAQIKGYHDVEEYYRDE